MTTAGLLSPRIEVRCASAVKLGRDAGREALAPLEKALRDPDPLFEWFARTALDAVRARVRASLPAPTPERLAELHHQLDAHVLEDRVEAVQELLLLGLPASLEPLLSCLEREDDAAVLIPLLHAVGCHRAVPLRDRLLSLLDACRDDVRLAALEALWGWSDPAVVEAATALLASASPRMRGGALVLLIRSGEERGPATAHEALCGPVHWERLAAVYALGAVEGAWARDLLQSCITGQSHPSSLRALAREVIAASGAGTPTAPGAAEDLTVRTDLTRNLPAVLDVEAARQALQSRDVLTRLHGVQNAARFSPDAVRSPLLRLARRETEVLVVSAVAKALARMGGDEALVELERLLDHEDGRVRANALEAIALVKQGAELLAICRRKMGDESPRVRGLAAACLHTIEPEESTRQLRQMIMGADAPARVSAFAIIAGLRDSGLISLFQEALKDPRREVYERALEALDSAAGSWPGAATLLERYHAGNVAGEVVDGEPVQALLAAMNSPRSSDRIRAMDRLVHAQDPRVESVLELHLSSRDPEVRRHATRTLADRYRVCTLPRLLRSLGESYLETAAVPGAAGVPRRLAARLEQETQATPAADTPAANLEERLGRILRDAFEEDVEFAPRLRAICMDVRIAEEHVGEVAGRAEDAGATDRRAAELARMAGLSGDEEEDDAVAPEPEAPPAPRPRYLAPALGIGLATALIAWTWSASDAPLRGAPDEDGPPSLERSVRLLDEMSAEPDAKRFAASYRDRRLVFSGRLVQLNGTTGATLRSGSVLFNITFSGASAAARQLKPGQPCEVEARVIGSQPDGSIDLEGRVIVGVVP